MANIPASLLVINLDRATERWQRVQQSHADFLAGTVALERLPATDTSTVERDRIAGTLSAPEKGCLLSHLRALEILSQRGSGPHWIAEDDVAFGEHTMQGLARTLDKLAGVSWDILFTDVTIAKPGEMHDLWMHRDRLRGKGEGDLVDLATTAFGGTTSYLVNEGALTRIKRLIERMGPLNMPWDVWLRTMARQRRLTCLATVPFVTRVEHAPSQIQQDDPMYAWWGAYRDLMFCDPDVEGIAERLDRIESPPVEAALFGRIMGGVSHIGLLTPAQPMVQSPREPSTARASSEPSRGSASNIDSTA